MPSSTAPRHAAAWINAKHARLEVGDAPVPEPGAGQILVRNHAIAINPIDWIIQVEGTLAYKWLRYPAVLGCDVAGQVTAVGAGVTRFRVGDRVLGLAVGTDKNTNDPAQGAFADHTVILERLACPIPDTMAYADAAVLPLAVATASCALFQADHLALRYPTDHPEPTGATVLVWGGSTSVGSQAIQLAVTAGYDVITTCSPRNYGYVTALGATQTFDYNSPTVTQEISQALEGRTFAGAVAIGTTSAAGCVRIAARAKGNKSVSMASPPVSFAPLADNRGPLAYARLLGQLITANVALQARARTSGTTTKFVIGTTLKNNDVSTAVFEHYLPAALASGAYQAAPAPTVVGHDLTAVQTAMDTHRKGVSRTKLVITLN